MTDGPVRVRHPILRLDVVAPDGTRTSEHRVFCRLRDQSVAVEACSACTRCDAIVEAPEPAVECTIVIADAGLAYDELGVRTGVGAVLARGAVVLESGASMGEALRVLLAENRHSIAVVDADHRMRGVVYETAFLGSRADADLDAITSSAVSIHESVPVRRALELLAAGHLREATIVDDDDVPLGIFRDIDGLAWLHRARRG